MFWKPILSYLHICVLSHIGHCFLYVYVWFVCVLFCLCFYSAPTANLNSNTPQTLRQSPVCWDPIQGECLVEEEHIDLSSSLLKHSSYTVGCCRGLPGSVLLSWQVHSCTLSIEGDVVSAQCQRH